MSHPRSIAVLSPYLDMHYYYVGIFAGIHEIAQQHNASVIAIKANPPRDIAPPSLAWDRVDGWIAIMHSDGLEAIAGRAPLVTIGGAYTPDLGCPSVMPDNRGGTETLVSHLIEHGHRHIAFIGYLENPDIRQRYEGYQSALLKHGISLNPRLVCPCPMDGFGKKDGAEAANRLIGLGLPCTAIVGGTDLLAIGAMDALKTARLRVPEDVAVVGFDDLYIAQYTTPSLTTARHPFEALGRTACRLLFDQIEGRHVPAGTTFVSTAPVMRRSCGCHSIEPKVRHIPLQPASRATWQEALAHQLLHIANAGETGDRMLIPTWPGATRLVEGLAAALSGADGVSPVILEHAWHEIVDHMVDLHTLQRLHALLEQTGQTQIATNTYSGTARPRLQSFLEQCHIEMLRAYRARNIGRTSNIQRLIETNYEISTEISMWSGLGTGRGQRLAWLRHIPTQWGCLARWNDREAGVDGTIVVSDTYTRNGAPLLAEGATYTAATFPPDELLLSRDDSNGRDIVAIVPFHTPGQQWWILAMRLTLETEFLTDRENMGMWTTLLAASLEREALLASITEQQQRLHVANRSLLAAKEAAEKADALKTRLLANVSHELRTPLDTILGYSEAALRQPNPYGSELPQGLVDDVRQIVRSGNHLVRLIDDLLDLSRAEVDALELVRERIDSHAQLQEIFDTFVRTREELNGVQWRAELPEQLPTIEADPVRLRQILLNLLSNARKFTESGEVVLGAAVAPPHLHIWVQDTGIGISPELQARMFEPFVTGNHANRRKDGVGLGLSITRRLVALHGGILTLESQPDHGTTFHLYLPLPGQGEQLSTVSSALEPVILAIAPISALAPAIVELGTRMQVSIRNLENGDDLPELLATARPVAVAWDSNHARDEQLQLLQRIRSHPQLCRLPLIMYGEDGSTEGVTNLMLKPVSASTLAGVIEQLHPTPSNGPILVVDDDPQARQLYSHIIASALPDHPIRLAEGGQAALQIVDEVIPALVILDLMMPDIDGFSVLETLRSQPQTHAVPVLVLSGQLLSSEHIKRLAHARVVFHSKDTLDAAETGTTLQRILSGTDALPQQTSILVKRTLAYLHQNYSRSLSRQEIADAVGVHTRYLSKIFHQEQGFSPWDYLDRYRVMQAKELLRASDRSITTVATLVGFEDLTYFGRVFRKHVGCSPRDFRDRLNTLP